MTDEAQALTDDNRSAAREIATWFAERHEVMSRTASRQLTYIWLLVASGIVALLFLPLVIEFIDFRLRAQTPPLEVVAEAEMAALALTADVDARRAQRAGLVRELDEAQKGVTEIDAQIKTMRKTIFEERDRLQAERASATEDQDRLHAKRRRAIRERQEKLGSAQFFEKPIIEAQFAGRLASIDAEISVVQSRLQALSQLQINAPGDIDPRITGLLAGRAGLLSAFDAQKAGLASADASLEEQLIVVAAVRKTNEALEDALNTAEPIRQAVSITTRIALLGLLIFLVQIVVNRYRYLQRLAGFYQARAQAFQLVASTPEGQAAGMLDGVKLGELTAALSPDAIGFDKTADPPTNQISTLLQAAMRR